MAEQASAPVRVLRTRPPRECSRTYPGTADQVRHVRRFARVMLGECPVADEVVLLLSELSANAVQYSRSQEPGGTFTVRLRVADGEHVCAEIRDDGGSWTARAVRDDGRGHGLNILRQVASAWGREGSAESGWTVWFRLDWAA